MIWWCSMSRLLAIFIIALSTSFASAGDFKKIDFVHDIAPILKARCVECHANGKYKAGVSFDTREDLLKSKEISEDDERRGQDEIQRLTDRYIAEVDKAVAEKEKDLMSV